jgi:threonine/homoserine/homoserine lactone efflux protein
LLNTFLGGLRLGIILQLSVGPVFLFVLQTAITRGITSALLAVTAVTLIDACYILLALLGIRTTLCCKRDYVI